MLCEDVVWYAMIAVWGVVVKNYVMKFCGMKMCCGWYD